MNKQNIIDLTKIVYKLTLFFPKKEPLRYKTREVADNILENFLGDKKPSNFDFLISQLEIIDSFFEVAKEQNWVKNEEILEIQKEYANLKQEIEINKKNNLSHNIQSQEKRKFLFRVRESENNSEIEQRLMFTRKEKIIEFLQKMGKGQVSDIKRFFPQVSKRTIRRDFEDLLREGKVVREGEWNKTFYKIR